METDARRVHHAGGPWRRRLRKPPSGFGQHVVTGGSIGARPDAVTRLGEHIANRRGHSVPPIRRRQRLPGRVPKQPLDGRKSTQGVGARHEACMVPERRGPANPSPRRGPPRRGSGPGTFAFLGFTHHWGRTRRGGWAVKRKTAADRFSRSMKAIRCWCQRSRHRPMAEQWRTLCQKLRGHYGYYGIIGNYRAIRRFHDEVRRTWRKWLSRRSDRGRIPWDRWSVVEQRYALPRARLRRSLS